MLFDIVIPLGPNDVDIIEKQIQYTKKNIIGFRNIYIVTYNTNIQIDGCITIDENIFQFKEFIKNYFAQYNGKNNRNGWYFQQLIKLYAGKFIENILDNYLIVDADVFFLKPTQFIENNKPIFTVGDEHHIPYFKHMNILHNSFQKYCQNSGITHHMMFNKYYLNEMFKLVEDLHSKPFWQVFILSVDEHTKHALSANESGASEYELYFNYMYAYHINDIIVRKLTWTTERRKTINIYSHDLNKLQMDFISLCHY